MFQSHHRLWIGTLGPLALLRLGRAFLRLLSDSGPLAAIDLRLRHEETLLWFSGGDVYGLARVTYPPGTYAILFPALGWNDFNTARWLWAGLSLLLCAFLVRTVWRAAGAVNRAERTSWAFLVLAMASVSVTIGNGQMGLCILVVLLAAISRIDTEIRSHAGPLASAGRGFHHSLLAALLALALIKPTASLPFLWLFVALGAWRGLIGGLLLYSLLTLGAAGFQDGSLPGLVSSWLEQSRLSQQEPGYANLSSLLGTTFPPTGGLSLSLLAFLGAGAWVIVHRNGAPWALAGLLGIVARLWTYHRIYDDLLLIPAVIALYRHPGGAGGKWRQILLLLSLTSLLAPGSLRLLPFPWGRIYEFWQVTVWLALLAFMAFLTRQEAQASPDPAGQPVERIEA